MELSKVILLKCVLFVVFVGGATSERAGGHALIHFYLGNGEVDVWSPIMIPGVAQWAKTQHFVQKFKIRGFYLFLFS
jgi:hypothetical protein